MIPKQEIEHLVRRTHVGTPDEELLAEIDQRTTHWPETARKSARDFALQCHHKNQQLVRRFRL